MSQEIGSKFQISNTLTTFETLTQSLFRQWCCVYVRQNKDQM